MKSSYEVTHAAVFLAVVACAVLLSSECIRSNPVIVDEYAHVPAGISHWDLGRHFLYRENPPFVRLLATLPVWLSRPKMVYTRAATTYRSEWDVGQDFINANGERHRELFMRARCVILLLAVACGMLIFQWASESYGGRAGVVCASLWLIDPTVLANSSIATVDIGSATFGLVATYLFWRFLRRAGWVEAILAGIGLGVAQASKFSLLALNPAWFVLMLFARFLPARVDHASGSSARPSWRKLGAIYLLSILVLDALYAFDRVGKPLGSFDFKSALLTAQVTNDLRRVPDGNRFRGTWLAEFPTPLPEDYVRGFDSQKWDEEWGFLRLSRGRLVHRRSWYSPLETLAYKLPMGTLSLLAASALYWFLRSRRLRLAECVALVPALSLLALLCSQTGMNWAVRYALPALPFLCLCVGRPVQVAWAHPVWRWGVAACLLWNGAAVLVARPHFLSYGNELVGGFEGARREFAGSNLDWGQDLYRLARWRTDHPDTRPLVVLYYGALNPAFLGINDKGLPDSFLQSGEAALPASSPDGRKPFYLAISWNLLIGEPAKVDFESGLATNAVLRSPRLRFENAIARIGQTIYVFHIVPTAAEARSGKDITFDEMQSCLQKTSFEEGWRSTIL